MQTKELSIQWANMYKVYGISTDDYDRMFREQEGCCDICKRHQSLFKKRLSVDHCHETGKIRGLLCQGCNTALGFLREDKQSVMNMVIYIQRRCGRD